jgi:pantetheine-phosphate adenylyltransferase
MKTGFYAGSFDPITLGHVDIIRRSFALVDKLIIGIGISASKTPCFDFDQRKAMILDATGNFGRVEVVEFSGLLVDVARQSGANLIIRGLRSAQDFDYEAQMTAMNYKMAPDIQTVFLASAPETSFISSSLVRQIASMGGETKKFVTKAVAKELKKKFRV